MSPSHLWWALLLLEPISAALGCDPRDKDWDCCSPDNVCYEGQGDCDLHEDCAGDLVCGEENCQDWSGDCCKQSCDPGKNDWVGCCTDDMPCNKGEGDCEHDDNSCAAGLVCGVNNCRKFNPNAHAELDCCIRDACETGWTLFDGSCYMVVTDSGVSWEEASTKCGSYTAYLTSISTEEENNFIRSLVNETIGWEKEVWVGGKESDEEGTFVWTDGTAWNYQSWQSSLGYPKGTGGHCLQSKAGLWFDAYSCTEHPHWPAVSVCEK